MSERRKLRLIFGVVFLALAALYGAIWAFDKPSMGTAFSTLWFTAGAAAWFVAAARAGA